MGKKAHLLKRNFSEKNIFVIYFEQMQFLRNISLEFKTELWTPILLTSEPFPFLQL